MFTQQTNKRRDGRIFSPHESERQQQQSVSVNQGSGVEAGQPITPPSLFTFLDDLQNLAVAAPSLFCVSCADAFG